jgi:hypothetical protein
MQYNKSNVYKFLIPVIIIFLSLVSCEKEVHINLASSAAQVVVQGQVETGGVPYVMINNTISFFSTVDLKTLENSFIHGAKVTVSDGSRTITLREYSFDTGSNAKIYVYSVDTANFANIMLGEAGKTYTLTILYNGVTYKAVTKIPYCKAPDTLWFGTPQFGGRKTPTTAVQLFANYTDPDTPGNYVRYFTRRNHEQFFPSGIFSDEVVNGKTINNIALFAGYNDTGSAKRDSLIYFYPGDTVTVKWAEIDKGVFNYWNTFQFSQNSVGNPFSTPINVQSNVSNGALGVWAGYGSVLKTIVVPQ